MAEQETNVIVAIPSENDYVWKTSSEKVPHMTLLYLEDLSTDPDLESIVEFLAHVADTSMFRFFLDVDRRDTLGADDADVVFFTERSTKKMAQWRQTLLQNKSIFQAYMAVPQFPTWTPHLTLGYPTAPAHPDNRDYPGIQWVNFDKIALWTSDFSGPEFQLKDQYADATGEVSMTTDFASKILQHHGVKGQKWGVRRDRVTGAVETTKARVKKEVAERTGSDVVVRTKPGAGVRTVGGNKRDAHPDAVNARTSEQVAKRSTLDALSNEDLQKLVTRMNLESQYRNLAVNEDRRSTGEKYASSLLSDHGSLALAKLGPAGPVVGKVLEQTLKNSNKATSSGTVSKKKK